jgi:membrane protein DedA with SNARE-associated domain
MPKDALSPVSLGDVVNNLIVNYMDNLGYGGLFLLMTLESASLPLPSEVILPLAGYLVYIGHMDYLVAVIVSTAASLVGSMVDYALGYYVGYEVVLRVGRYVGIRESHLYAARNWFNRYGGPSVMIARLVPGLRGLISIPAGVARMSILLFLAYTAAGSLAWNALLIYLGFRLGHGWRIVMGWVLDYSIYMILLLVAVVVTLVVISRLRRRP